MQIMPNKLVKISELLKSTEPFVDPREGPGHHLKYLTLPKELNIHKEWEDNSLKRRQSFWDDALIKSAVASRYARLFKTLKILDRKIIFFDIASQFQPQPDLGLQEKIISELDYQATFYNRSIDLMNRGFYNSAALYYPTYRNNHYVFSSPTGEKILSATAIDKIDAINLLRETNTPSRLWITSDANDTNLGKYESAHLDTLRDSLPNTKEFENVNGLNPIAQLRNSNAETTTPNSLSNGIVISNLSGTSKNEGLIDPKIFMQPEIDSDLITSAINKILSSIVGQKSFKQIYQEVWIQLKATPLETSNIFRLPTEKDLESIKHLNVKSFEVLWIKEGLTTKRYLSKDAVRQRLNRKKDQRS